MLYIRHGEDIEGRYKNDWKLTQNGKEEIKKRTLELIEIYGIPDIIYYSPLYRTRQTAKLMVQVIEEKTNIKVKAKMDVNLGRFFSYREKDFPNIRESTLNKGIIINETWKQFRYRVKKQFIKKLNDNRKIWNITHSLVLLRVASLKNIDINPRVKFLDYISVER
jgi:broad specificity phosphatase PhoE